MKQKQLQTKTLVLRLNRIVKELIEVTNQIEDFEDKRANALPRCAKCGIRNVRVRQDKTYFCYSCGHDTQNKEEKA